MPRMYLIQILLPLYDNRGRRIAGSHFESVKEELTERFHGLTAYSRSVAEGFWEKGKATHRDDIIVYEVMVPKPDKAWWGRYRRRLEKRFQQEVIVIRGQRIRMF
jgi:hypothetical protein